MAEIKKEFEIRHCYVDYLPEIIITGSVDTMITGFFNIPTRGDTSKKFLGLGKYILDDGREWWYRIYER